MRFHASAFLSVSLSFQRMLFKAMEKYRVFGKKRNSRDRKLSELKVSGRTIKQYEYFNVIPKFIVLDIFARDGAITSNHHLICATIALKNLLNIFLDFFFQFYDNMLSNTKIFSTRS